VAWLQEHRVQQLNAAAARVGVCPGMRRATALALAPDLLPVLPDPARDAAALQALVHAALAFTPMVVSEGLSGGSATVLLELQASLRLFGGWPRLLQRLARNLAPLGHRLQAAAAPTALAAAVLARSLAPARPADALALPARQACPGVPATPDLLHGPHLEHPGHLAALLHRLPPWALPAGMTRQEAFEAVGLQTLGALRKLPRAALARRFGTAWLADRDRAFGRLADPRVPVQPPDTFQDRLELHARAEHTEPVLAAAAVLLQRVAAWARARQARLRAFTLRLLHERSLRSDEMPHPPSVLHVALAEPSDDALHLQGLLRERLGCCRLAASVLELQLECHDLAPGAAPSGELFPGRQARTEGLLRLLDRLRARLGDAAVVQILPLSDHRPEHAQREVPVQALPPPPREVELPAARPGRPWTQPWPPAPPLPLHRPVWLWPEPLPLAERDGLPLLEGGALQLLLGPERIETAWWDDEPVLRDYYVATPAHAPAGRAGALLWIWRNRLPDAQGRMPWFLQGRFG
jgi:protein ImuB